MYLIELTLTSDKDFDRETVEDVLFSLIGSLKRNGQILGEESQIATISNGYRCFFYLPMMNSLDYSNANKYVKQDLEKLNQIGMILSVDIIGEYPESSEICKCEKHDYFILYTNYISIESPLRCGKCFGVIPLYLIHPTYDNDEYHDIICWQSDYRACDGLQMCCQTGERFGMREISRVDSSLSRRGITICNKIKELTGIPVYYYLYRYNNKSRKFEERRKCPSCGGEWLLNERIHGIFDFKCDQCFLLSNISWGAQ